MPGPLRVVLGAQLPMAQNGRQSGGRCDKVPAPAKAKSDAATQWSLKKTPALLEKLLAIRGGLKSL